MTEHDAALAFDQALDGAYTHDLNGAEPLVQTARTVQSLFDRQHAIPSEEFIMQLEGTLFPTTVVPPSAEAPHPLVVPTGVERPPAAAVARPQPLPRPARVTPDIRRISNSRLVAIAAVLALVIGGMGAILGGPFDPRSTPEPSSIPAAILGTVEASPAPVAEGWNLAPPDGSDGFTTLPGIIDNGAMYRSVHMKTGFSTIQAIDLQDGQVTWEVPTSVTPFLTALTDEVLLLVGTDQKAADFPSVLAALDRETGAERWRISLVGMPVGMLVADGRVFVLNQEDVLEAFDIETQHSLWKEDFSELVPMSPDRFAPIFSYGRLAMIDGALGMVLSNGRLAVLEGENGQLRWADERTNDGQTSLSVLDDRFVVTAVASYGMDVADDPYNNPPSPVAGIDPKADPCGTAIQTRQGSTPETVAEYGETIDSFDPATGDSPWGLRSHAAVWIFLADDSNLIADIRPGWNPEIGNDVASIYCMIDGTTGDVSETSGIEFVSMVVSGDDPNRPLGIGGLAESVPIYVGLDAARAKAFPEFETDWTKHIGVRWVQRFDALIVITMQDGALVALPEDAPRWEPVDPNAAIATWTVAPPDGATGEKSTPGIIEDETLVRILPAQASAELPAIQAIDLASGSMVWERQSPIEPLTMAVHGDLVLVGGLPAADGTSSGLLVALDNRNGEERWRMSFDQPVVGVLVADDEFVVLQANDWLAGYDLKMRFVNWETDLGLYDETPSAHAERPGLSTNRLVNIDDSIAAITSNGAMIVIDGNRNWRGAKPNSGTATAALAAVDDRYVVISVGEGGMSGTKSLSEPAPLASPASGVDDCRQMIVAGDELSSSHVAADEQVVESFDPESGAFLWSIETNASIKLHLLDDDDLIAVIPPTGEIEGAAHADSFCRIDGDNGRVSEFSDLTPDLVFDDPALERTLGVAVMADANGLTMDVAPEVAASLPLVDGAMYGHFEWIQDFGDRLLITAEDGTLIGLPKNSPSRSSS